VTGRGGGRIYDYHTTSATAMVNEPCVVQAMTVTIRGNHTYYSDLTVSISGPMGQRATLQRRRRRNPFRTYTVTRALGTQAQGMWRVSIRDTVGADSGHLNGFTMHLTCQ
jgi:subtilisin-like proprotein convertase family protein